MYMRILILYSFASSLLVIELSTFCKDVGLEWGGQRNAAGQCNKGNTVGNWTVHHLQRLSR